MAIPPPPLPDYSKLPVSYQLWFNKIKDLIGTGTFAPVNALYVTLSTDGTLTNERVLTAGTGIALVDGGAGGTITINNTASGAPGTAQYLTLALDGSLTNERRFVAGTGLSAVDGGAGGDYTLSLSAPVSVSNGGTGAGSFTAGAVLLGNGTSAIAVDTGLTFDTVTDKLTVGGNIQIGATGRIDRGSNPLIRANGTDNVFIGNPAGGGSVTTANINASVGVDALRDVTSGSNNAAVGTRALRNLQGGSQNVAIGPDAMIAGTGPTSNSAIGFSAGYNLAGTNNEAIGANALANASSGSLFGNTAVGSSALTGITTSGVSYNVGIGSQAGDSISTGSQNTIIGASADVSSGSATNRTAIGYNASCTADNTIQLGNSSVTYVNTQTAYRINGTQVLQARITGWGAPTGTPTRTTFATGTVTLTQLAERVKALIDDLTTHGVIGT